MAKTLRSITLVLGNVASLDIRSSDISSFTLSGINENIVKAGSSSVFYGKTVTDAVLVLRPQANRVFDTGEDGEVVMLFDKLRSGDVTMMRLNFDNKNSEDYHLFWGDIGFKSNDYQRTEVVCDHLIIGVGINRSPFSHTVKKIIAACAKMRELEDMCASPDELP